MNKEKYIPAEMEIVTFEVEDIITTSGVSGGGLDEGVEEE